MRQFDSLGNCSRAKGLPRACAALAGLLTLTACSTIEDVLGGAPAANATPEIIVTYVSRPASGAPTVIALATMTPEAAPIVETSAPPSPVAPSACPAPASPTPPARPVLFSDIPAALTPYLGAGATLTATRDLLTAWGVIFDAPDGSVTLGGVYQGRFLPGNDPATVVVIFDPEAQTPGLRAGDVIVYTCANGAVQVAYRAQDDPLFAGAVGYPRVLSTGDVTGDGVDELSFVTGECGASTCFDVVSILSFAADGVTHLIPDFAPHPFPAFAFAPANGTAVNSAQNLVVQVGQYGSAGAGPQRNALETWSWTGSVFTLTRVVVDPPVYRVHALHDADVAFRAGDLATATALYQRVVSDPALKAWDGPAPLRDEDKILGAFALYRLMELAARQQDAAGAGAAYEALKQATPPGSPGELYGALGDAFYSVYRAGGNYAQACDAAVKFAEKTANIYILLGSQTFGYANYDYLPPDMCVR